MNNKSLPYIIAEIGSNFHTIEDCLKCISYAKQVGANAVKFQMATEEELYGFDAGLSINNYFIKPDWLDKLKNKADSCGIDFLCTGFSFEGYSIIDRYVEMHKLASCENMDPTLHAFLLYTNKPKIISLGGTSNADTIRLSKLFKDHIVYFMYCVIQYPCYTTQLEKIIFYKSILEGHKVGFSDHSLDYTTIPVSAVLDYGAVMVEKHFNPLGLDDRPDSGHSLNRDQFKIMVDRINKINYTVYGEHDAILKHKRRLIATRDIKKGEALIESNVGVHRSLKSDASGSSPYTYFDIITGLNFAKNDFKVGDAIIL